MYESAQQGMDALDFRSDTVTRPSTGMWDAMRSAPPGDDVFRDDPTILEFEGRWPNSWGKRLAFCAIRDHGEPDRDSLAYPPWG